MRNTILPALLLISSVINAQKIEVNYQQKDFKGPFSGKVLLYLSKENKEPRDGDFMIRISPYYSIDVKNIQPGQKVIFDDKAASFPHKLSDIERGDYYIQAVWDRNLGGRAIGASPGNLYSKTQKLKFDKQFNKLFSIVATEMVPEKKFVNTEFAKELSVRSGLLSSFHKKDFYLHGAVLLPADYYNNPDKKFPLLVLVSGFGGDYKVFSDNKNARGRAYDSTQFITLFIDGNCSLGHSVYANSDNNGPWGDALTQEMIPALEKEYRCNGFRFVTGHSSGGWTVLWLQTHYPDFFDGCWSSSPDPVDFRKFQPVNLYEDDNMYYQKDSTLNVVASIAGFVPIDYMKDYYQMEAVQYRGGQMRSFDAVFSKRGANGEPERLVDAATGKINKAVFEHWKNYDISLYLRNNWKQLEPSLKNKITVSVGENDNFILNPAVHLLEEEMKKLSADIVFKYYVADHFTIGSPEYRKDQKDFILLTYKNWLQKNH